MTRIRRTFIATLVASAVTAATFGAAPSSAASGPTAIASACTWEVWKITKRENVTCRKAKRVLKGEYGDADKVPGWHCTNKGDLIPEGRCTKGGTNKSFKYAPKPR